MNLKPTVPAIRFIWFVAMALSCLAVPSAFARVFDWECVFPVFEAPTRYVFDQTNSKAYFIGNVGTSPLSVHIGSIAITFSEELDSGAVQTTTILPKSGLAVHSRHTVIGEELVQTQALGACKLRP